MSMAELTLIDNVVGKEVSPTYYKDGIDPRLYSFIFTNKWFYQDLIPDELEERAIRWGGSDVIYQATNANDLESNARKWVKFLINNYELVGNFEPSASFKNSHMVLFDATNMPRYALSYKREEDSILKIDVIRRLRTQYVKKRKAYNLWMEKHYWSPELETESSREFGYVLGMHPAEFLLSEFIYRHRNELRQKTSDDDISLILDLSSLQQNGKVWQLYMSLVDRFFEPINGMPKKFRLNKRKERVQKLLSL